MGKKKSISGMTDPELRASGALVKNQKARQTAETIRKNKEIVKQIQKLRGGSLGMGGRLGGGGGMNWSTK
jgi:hypothetical protein